VELETQSNEVYTQVNIDIDAAIALLDDGRNAKSHIIISTWPKVIKLELLLTSRELAYCCISCK